MLLDSGIASLANESSDPYFDFNIGGNSFS
jgi:hypothetical protein